MKIAHISDLHIFTNHRPENLHNTKQLLEHALRQNVDHFVITGDISHNSDAEDFSMLRKTFKEYGILNTKKLSLVIGNHDIFGGVHLAEDILTFPEKCQSIDYEIKISEFKYYFFEAFEEIICPIEPELFPFVKILGNVVLIGLNSIARYSKVKNLFASKGKVCKHGLLALNKILEKTDSENRTKVILMHHHFTKDYINTKEKKSFLQNIEGRAMQLRKKEKLYNFFRRHNIDLILHGHLHESTEYQKKQFRFINAGGTIDGNDTNYLQLNIISIKENREIHTEIQKVPKISKNRIRKHTSHLAEIGRASCRERV